MDLCLCHHGGRGKRRHVWCVRQSRRREMYTIDKILLTVYSECDRLLVARRDGLSSNIGLRLGRLLARSADGFLALWRQSTLWQRVHMYSGTMEEVSDWIRLRQ